MKAREKRRLKVHLAKTTTISLKFILIIFKFKIITSIALIKQRTMCLKYLFFSTRARRLEWLVNLGLKVLGPFKKVKTVGGKHPPYYTLFPSGSSPSKISHQNFVENSRKIVPNCLFLIIRKSGCTNALFEASAPPPPTK